MLLLSLGNPQCEVKRQALGEIGKTFVSADYHHFLVIRNGGRIVKAKYNLPVITRATEYIGSLGSNTGVYREIARVAAETDHECERLEAVLDLAIVRTSNPRSILALAESACRLETPAHEEAWQKAYDTLLEGAEYPSVEEAIAIMRGL